MNKCQQNLLLLSQDIEADGKRSNLMGTILFAFILLPDILCLSSTAVEPVSMPVCILVSILCVAAKVNMIGLEDMTLK